MTSALLLYNNITFSTHQPAVASPTSCSSLGTARVYNISYLNAAGTGDQRFGVISGGGLPPSPVAGRVQLDDGSLRDFIIGGSSDSPLKVSEPTAPGTSPQPKSWVFWDIER